MINFKHSSDVKPLTVHPLQTHKTADKAVKVDVHVLIGVTHCDNVVQWVVESEP